MSQTKYTLFSQVLRIFHKINFQKIVDAHQADKHSKGFDTWSHFVSMLFMQFAKMDSLRDICLGMKSAAGNLNHMGVEKAPTKSNLSYQNKKRPYEVFEDVYYKLLEELEPSLRRRKQYARRIRRKMYVIDSSIIPLSLSLFDWAKYRTTKGAIKMHAVLDYDSSLPKFMSIGEGKEHDIKAAKTISFPSGSVLVADRAYLDFSWLYDLDSYGVFFVTRLKTNVNIAIAEEYLTDEKHEHILSDQDIELVGVETQKKYPKNLRIVKVYDEENDNELILLTNNLSWTADTVSQLYKARWSIETFFKHIKQLFKIKSFVGTSPNAVRIQMWCALINILLFRYLENRAKYEWHLSNLVNFVRVTLYCKIDLWKWLNNPMKKREKPPPEPNLFNLEGV